VAILTLNSSHRVNSTVFVYKSICFGIIGRFLWRRPSFVRVHTMLHCGKVVLARQGYGNRPSQIQWRPLGAVPNLLSCNRGVHIWLNPDGIGLPCKRALLLGHPRLAGRGRKALPWEECDDFKIGMDHNHGILKCFIDCVKAFIESGDGLKGYFKRGSLHSCLPALVCIKLDAFSRTWFDASTRFPPRRCSSIP
jgi:hypothetical protein